MDWIAVLLIVMAVLALVGCILQIVWIRAKLGNYSQTQMATSLATQSAMMKELAVQQPTAQVYSLLVNAPLTVKINKATSPENIALSPLAAPQEFNVPQICNNTYFASGTVSCNSVSFLVVNINDSVSQFILDIQNGTIMYVMINSLLYRAKYDVAFQNVAINADSAYSATYILALYTMDTEKNVSKNGASCTMSIVPFFGTLSKDGSAAITTALGLTANGSNNVPVHMMAIMLPKKNPL